MTMLPMALVSTMLIAAFALAGNILGRNAVAHNSEASMVGAGDYDPIVAAQSTLDGKGSLLPDGYTIASINLDGLRRQTVIAEGKGDRIEAPAQVAMVVPVPAKPIPKAKPANLVQKLAKAIKIIPASAEPDTIEDPQAPVAPKAVMKPSPAVASNPGVITPEMKAKFLAKHNSPDEGASSAPAKVAVAHPVHSAELNCLARAVYFEARSEPDLGQLAVAKVILNRLKSPDFPKTICGVVYQGSQNRNGCQFSFACDGVTGTIRQPSAWAHAQEIAQRALDGDPAVANLSGAVNYHADYVSPSWSHTMRRMIRIGHHIFYAKRNNG